MDMVLMQIYNKVHIKDFEFAFMARLIVDVLDEMLYFTQNIQIKYQIWSWKRKCVDSIKFFVFSKDERIKTKIDDWIFVPEMSIQNVLIVMNMMSRKV